MSLRGPHGSASHTAGEPINLGFIPPTPQRVHSFPHEPYGSTTRIQHQYQQQQHQQLQVPPQHQLSVQAGHYSFPQSYSQLQGEPFAMIARTHQMVDVLTEENRMLRQEMEVCREKVTKLHKVKFSAF